MKLSPRMPLVFGCPKTKEVESFVRAEFRSGFSNFYARAYRKFSHISRGVRARMAAAAAAAAIPFRKHVHDVL